MTTIGKDHVLTNGNKVQYDQLAAIEIPEVSRFKVHLLCLFDRDHESLPLAGKDFEKVFLLCQRPIDVDELKNVSETVVEQGASEVVHLHFKESPEEVFPQIQEQCVKWNQCPERENPALKTKDYVKFQSTSRDSTNHLYSTAVFAHMGKLLLQLQRIAKIFADQIRRLFPSGRDLEAYRDKIKEKVKNPKAKMDSKGTDILRLPKVLLLGDSGVGKTLIANYLQERIRIELQPLFKSSKQDQHHPPRIPIPEFNRKEDDFEYHLFGYAKGAYTGGSADGNCGLLARNLGQVVFLDEIGAANSIIQGKLLAYLDDYMIRPRGLNGNSIFCPTLIVAASNETEKIRNSVEFRNDLINRFDHQLPIPNLKERLAGCKDNFKYILDCVLQDGDFADFKIQEVGEKAFDCLWNHFANGCKGNFRELEQCMRDACQRASDDKRDYLVQADIQFNETTSA